MCIRDRNDGFMYQYRYRNIPLLKNSLHPFFWRAPTDNDLGNGMPERCAVWKNAHEELLLQSLDTSKVNNTLVINALYLHKETQTQLKATKQEVSFGQSLINQEKKL